MHSRFFLRRSRPLNPLNTSLRSFTPSNSPQHPIHNADFEDENSSLIPAPLFAEQDRPLRATLPATTVASLAENFDLMIDEMDAHLDELLQDGLANDIDNLDELLQDGAANEIDAHLDELLQDGTARRLREAEIAAAEASSQASQAPQLPPRHGNSQSLDISTQEEVIQDDKFELFADRDSSLGSDVNISTQEEVIQDDKFELFADRDSSLGSDVNISTPEEVIQDDPFKLLSDSDSSLGSGEDTWLQEEVIQAIQSDFAYSNSSSSDSSFSSDSCCSYILLHDRPSVRESSLNQRMEVFNQMKGFDFEFGTSTDQLSEPLISPKNVQFDFDFGFDTTLTF